MLFDEDEELTELLSEPFEGILKEYFDQCDLVNCDPLRGMLIYNVAMMKYLLDEYNITWQIYCTAMQGLCADPEVRNMLPKRKIN